MENHPPFLLLDVDGVLNPFPGPGGSMPAKYLPYRLDPFGRPDVPVWLNPEHGSWISATRSHGIVRPVWATSWRAEANRLIAPRLGMPSLPYIDFHVPDIDTPHPHGYLWKRDQVAEWVKDAPLLWIDDDFAVPDHEWAKQRTLRGIPTLLIQPDPYEGLQRSHIDAVRTWAPAAMRTLAEKSERESTPDSPLSAVANSSRHHSAGRP